MVDCIPQIHRRIERSGGKSKLVPSGLETVTFFAEEQLGRHERMKIFIRRTTEENQLWPAKLTCGDITVNS
jgi:hypothetical protein